jgi:alpha-mannosidase
MIAAPGLPEYELIPGEAGATIAVTLLRCVGWLSREDLANRRGHAGPALATPGAQLPGEHHFAYSIIPFGHDLDAAANEAYAFEAPLMALAAPLSDGPLPPTTALVRVEPPALVVTAMKPAERGGGFVIRFYNSADRAVAARVSFGLPVTAVVPVNLLEELAGEPLPLDAAGGLALDVPPKRVVSLLAR